MIDYKKELALSSNHSPFSLERGWGEGFWARIFFYELTIAIVVAMP